ncbi:MAG: pantoate--beta-alanine ligase [Bdellovibrionota bacterium]
MKIVQTIAEVQSFVREKKKNGQSIGFVPTMGALHKGHMSLIDASKQENNVTVMSIYVNPTQFGPKEDLASYFRPIEKDKAMARDYAVDLLFLPSDETMYSRLQSVAVTEKHLSQVLCGAYRPGHFDGVCTIVSKLLHIVNPDRLYSGMKDAQQLRIIEKWSKIYFSLCKWFQLQPREDDGLACSSCNNYLDTNRREIAPVLFQHRNKDNKHLKMV